MPVYEYFELASTIYLHSTHIRPHFYASQGGHGALMNFQDFEAETAKLEAQRRQRVDLAAARVKLRRDRLSGMIFAQNGPIGVAVANVVVAADELKFGRRLLHPPARLISSRLERDLDRDELPKPEFVPNIMWQWFGIATRPRGPKPLRVVGKKAKASASRFLEIG